MNPLFRTLLILLLVLFAAIIILLLKRLHDNCERNRKPKFCGDKLGLHFKWTGKGGISNIDLQYNKQDGPCLPSLLANASYIHTYLLSEECVEKIVLVSENDASKHIISENDASKHIKPNGQCGWTLYVSANFQNQTCRNGVINRIEISPQIEKKVNVDVYTANTANDNPIRFSLDMNNVNPYDHVDNMFDSNAIELEVYRFR